MDAIWYIYKKTNIKKKEKIKILKGGFPWVS